MIKMKKVLKIFDGFSIPVIKELDLNIKKGDFCILIGANGSGKSTITKLISGEYKADSGVIDLQGKVAQVTQDINAGTIAEMTLLENISLILSPKANLAFYERFRKEISEIVSAIGIDLESKLDLPLKFLSGGQRQVVATLMSIYSNREILLLDEHTSALDPKMEKILMDYTAKMISQKSLTTLMITHKMTDAIKYGNRLIMLHQGKIVLDIEGDNKKSLKEEEILSLFHQYEDEILISREEL